MCNLQGIIAIFFIILLNTNIDIEANTTHKWWLTFSPSTTGSSITLEIPEEEICCECVSYLLCVNGSISTAGGQAINIRNSVTVNVPYGSCPSQVEVCCTVPDPQSKCLTQTHYPTPSTSTISPYPPLPPDTPCECVSWSECEVDNIVSNGRGPTILHLHNGWAVSHSQCLHALDVCCTINITITTEPSFTTTSSPDCKCVEFYQCDEEGYIITSGEGLIDIRFGGAQQIDPVTDSMKSSCSEYQICCFLRPDVGGMLESSTSLPSSAYPPTTTYKYYETNDTIFNQYSATNNSLPSTYSPFTSTTTMTPPTCAKRHEDGQMVRIAGFSEGESQFGEFPWVVTLFREEILGGTSHYLFVAGGSLVHHRAVLTAAHSVESYPVSRLRVRVGDYDVATDKEPLPHQDLLVERVLTHPNYGGKRNLQFDIALLILKHPVTLAPNVQPICLANYLSKVNYTSCIVNGWGLDAFEGGSFQQIMKSVELPLVKHSQCQKMLRKTRLSRYFILHESFLCAGGQKGVDACKGDGGGPLSCRSIENPQSYFQVGITSWGIGCGVAGVPGVYASVVHVNAWLNDVLEELTGKDNVTITGSLIDGEQDGNGSQRWVNNQNVTYSTTATILTTISTMTTKIDEERKRRKERINRRKQKRQQRKNNRRMRGF